MKRQKSLKSLGKDDLRSIIRLDVPGIEGVAREFLKRPTQWWDSDDLRIIIEEVKSRRIKERAAWTLLGLFPKNNYLRFLIKKVKSRRIKERAAQRLLVQNFDEGDLCLIIEKVESESLQEDAAWALLRRSPDEGTLRFIFKNVKSREVRETVAWELWGQKPSKNTLRRIVKRIERLKEKSARELLVQNPDDGDLGLIVRWVDGPLKEEAKRKLSGR
ncbi:MAG TPA: hypothetical protein ENL27_02160 [Candidatus Parcubacteria bacterium]|nr:hypothetical protein [Candidatus Parcubacteria bacterium]